MHAPKRSTSAGSKRRALVESASERSSSAQAGRRAANTGAASQLKPSRWTSVMLLAGLMLSTVALGSCLNRDLKPLTPCTTSGVVQDIKITNVDKVDLLFILDGSNSMAEEIELLSREVPTLVRVLASGDLDGDPSTQEFPPVKDLNLGIVTVDMGTAGAGANNFQDDPRCVEDDQVYLGNVALGEDGILWNKTALPCDDPNSEDCECKNPPSEEEMARRYLTFTPPEDEAQLDGAVTELVNKFSCWQRLIKLEDGETKASGQVSCGFEQQLEAMMKATWPADNPELTFFQGTRGHAGAENAGFFRKDALWVMLLVTDEDDCSAPDSTPLEPNPNDPEEREDYDPTTSGGGPYVDDIGGATKEFNVLCQRAAEQQEAGDGSLLYDVERYTENLLKLRPDPSLLVFSAIVGLPIEGDAAKLYEDPLAIDFEGILEHEEMQYGEEFLCDRTQNERFTACLNGKDEGARVYLPRYACCIDCGDDEGGEVDEKARAEATAIAAPARRIVKLAQSLEEQGANGVVQPICVTEGADNDPNAGFKPAINAILVKIADSLGAVCLPRELDKDDESRVDCDVVETLPLPAEGVSRVTSCSELTSLGRDAEPVRVEEDGREVCRINQVPSVPEAATVTCNPSTGENCGWYYDDFSDLVKERCPPSAIREASQRVAFTEGSEPQSGSQFRLECIERVQSVPNIGVTLGSDCNPDESNCPEGLFCEPRSETCQQRCESTANCPNGYACDTEMAEPLCINPTCF